MEIQACLVSLIASQKITWPNFYKIQNFSCIQICGRPNFKKPRRKHTFMISTQKGGGEGVLKICQVFADSIILNNRSIANFCGLWKWEGHFLVISCGCHKWVTSKTIIISKKSLESKRVRNSRNFNLIIRHTVTYHFALVINIKNTPPPPLPHLAFTSSKPKIEPPEQCVEYVQS